MEKLSHEIKKITVDPESNITRAMIEFTLKDYSDLEKFKEALLKFQNKVNGQKELQK